MLFQMIFNIPPSWPVFVLDDSEDRLSWFRQFAKTSAAAIDVLSRQSFKVAFLDHDLHWMDAGFPNRQHGNGKEVARHLASHWFAGIVVIHSRSKQAAVMAKILPAAKVYPFGEFDIARAFPRRGTPKWPKWPSFDTGEPARRYEPRTLVFLNLGGTQCFVPPELRNLANSCGNYSKKDYLHSRLDRSCHAGGLSAIAVSVPSFIGRGDLQMIPEAVGPA